MAISDTFQHIPRNSPSITEDIRSSSRLGATLTDLIDVMDIAMWELDRDYRVVGFNRKAKEIYGASALGRFCYQAAAKLDTVCENCPAQQVFGGRASGRSERQRTRVTGEAIHIDHIATPIKDKDGAVTGALVLIIDITRHKEQEQELIAHRNNFEQMVIERTRDLEESRQRYRQLYEESRRGQALYLSLLNASADAIAIYDLEGCVQYLNPSFCRTFGWQLEEVQGKILPLFDDVESDALAGEFRSLRENGKAITNFLSKRPTKEGKLLDVSISAARYADHHGRPAGIIYSFRDVTEAKALELQFYRAQKFEALGTMAGGLAHDFNNLLMGILGSASLLLLDQASGKSIEKLKNIERYVRQGEKLTRQLLALGKGDRRAVSPVDLNALLDECATMFGQTRKEIFIHCHPQPQIWTVEADAGQLEQVLLNLFVNAAHAMPGGGELSLRTENVHLEEQETVPYQRQPGRYVKITVVDSGCGIDPQILDKIFDPFFTTKGKDRGTGLGLASAYGIINNHGGIIQAGNGPRGGAQFTLFLPASEKTVLQEGRLPDNFLPGTETILLVDDEEMVLDLTREMLERLGYRILSASSGIEALRIYREQGDRIDLVILDMVMPGMGGAELFQRLKDADAGIKTLLSTGYSLSDQAAEILNQGCQGFIQKPFTLLDVSRKIREILD